MPEYKEDPERLNYETFQECLSSIIIRGFVEKPIRARKARISRKRNTECEPSNTPNPTPLPSQNDTGELLEFIEYIAHEIFSSLPEELRTISFTTCQKDVSLASKYSDPLPQSTLESLLPSIPPAVEDSLTSYSLLPPSTSLAEFLSPVLSLYISSATAAPPPPSSTRASACEICARDYIPLTYHHLIPRAVHAKALKRGWHEEWELGSVAWLCRACHSFVHRMASNEELAREWWTVEKIRGREDVRDWANWVGRVRWKAR